MKLKSGLMLKKTGGIDVVVSLGEQHNDFKGIITLSGTGGFYWNLLKTEQTVESLVQSAVAEYDVKPEEAKADLLLFLDKLKEAGVLEG